MTLVSETILYLKSHNHYQYISDSSKTKVTTVK